METPDANGYVNVQWPSKHIPHGGIFHTRIAEPSDSQQKYLKVLLEEQRLSIAQRQKSAWRLREQERGPEAPPPPKQPLVRPRTSRRRPLSAIRESGVFELEPYQPIKRGEDRELLKSKLARSMEHGSEPQETPPPLKPPRVPKPKPKLPTNEEKRNELLTQIRERAEWLAEMEVLGHAAPHRDIVHDQIAERMRALDMYGIDSVCSSARSHRSGFSTTGDYVGGTARSKGSGSKSQRSNLSTESKEKQRSRRSSVKSTKPKEKQKSRRSSVKGKSNKKAEETVSAYSNIPPLQLSPRRRV